jgi:hypothetical protein
VYTFDLASARDRRPGRELQRRHIGDMDHVTIILHYGLDAERGAQVQALVSTEVQAEVARALSPVEPLDELIRVVDEAQERDSEHERRLYRRAAL